MTVTVHYPKPALPTQPLLTNHLYSLQKSNINSSFLNSENSRFVTSGRAAIALALEHAGINENDEVLVPAYHCSSMVQPIIYVKATPIFFKIKPPTNAIDLDDISKKITTKTKAIIVTHYFGFPQAIDEIQKYCNKNKLILIEDCAHAFFGSYKGKQLGTFGDYAIASVMKFFPAFDGGCLIANTNINISDIKLSDAGIKFEIKSLINTLERSFEYNHLKVLKYTIGLILKSKDLLWSFYKMLHKNETNTAIGPTSADGGFSLEENWIHKRMSSASRYFMRHADTNLIIRMRQENYRYFENAFMGLKGSKKLHDKLNMGVVPYVYPLIINNPKPVFDTLKKDGVPIIRFGEYLWDGVDKNTCPLSAHYSEALFQFPCHETYTKSDLDWIINKVIKAINQHEGTSI